MNTYYKFCPNVWLAKCSEQRKKGDVIQVSNKYGKKADCVVHNFIGRGNGDGFYYYSITRANGMNTQEYAKKKAKVLLDRAQKAEDESIAIFEKTAQDRTFLALAEPIKVGHHSENRHRNLINRHNRNMEKVFEQKDKAEDFKERAESILASGRLTKVDHSMPESLEYFKLKLEETKGKGRAKAQRDYDLAVKLWGGHD